MNKKFLKNLDNFQNKAVDTLLDYKQKKIIIKSQKFTGKSMIAGKLFKQADDRVVIYHTGCCPELFEKAKEEFIKVLDNNSKKNATIILDEFYDNEIMKIIAKNKNNTCYLLTNDLSLKNKDYMTFNYYEFYKTFVNNECGKYLDIHQVLNEDKEFSKKNESLRKYSRSTTIFIKENDNIKEYKMEM